MFGLRRTVWALAALTIACQAYPATWCHDYTLYRVSGRTRDYSRTTSEQLREALTRQEFKVFYSSDRHVGQNDRLVDTIQDALRSGDVVIFGDKHSGIVNKDGRLDHFVQNAGESGKSRSLAEMQKLEETAGPNGNAMLRLNWGLKEVINYSYQLNGSTVRPYHDQSVQIWRKPAHRDATRWTLVRTIVNGSGQNGATISSSGLTARTVDRKRWYLHSVNLTWTVPPKVLQPGAVVLLKGQGTAREVETKDRDPIGFWCEVTWEAGGVVPNSDLNDENALKNWRWNGRARFEALDDQKTLWVGYDAPGSGYKKIEQPGQRSIRVPAQAKLTGDTPLYAFIKMIIWNRGTVIWVYRAEKEEETPLELLPSDGPGVDSVGATGVPGGPLGILLPIRPAGNAAWPRADWLGITANAAEAAGAATGQSRELLFRYKDRNAAGIDARSSRLLAREYGDLSRILTRSGDLTGMLDPGLAVIDAADRLYAGDFIGVAETGANYYLSGVVTTWAGEQGVGVGFLVGGSLGGPVGALIGGAVGGAAGAFGASYAYDLVGKSVVGRMAATARDPVGRKEAAERFVRGLWSVYWRAYDLERWGEKATAKRLSERVVYALDSCRDLVNGGGLQEEAQDLRSRATAILKP